MKTIRKWSMFPGMQIVTTLVVLVGIVSNGMAADKKKQTERALVSGIVHSLPSAKKAHIVFLISLDPLNYEADRTIPPFAETLQKEHGYTTTVLTSEGKQSSAHFPNLDIIKKADLVVVFARRLALPKAQIEMLKDYLKAGKPMMGIRTANHAFSVAEKDIAAGHEAWWEFVPDVMGCVNNGYGPVEPGINVENVAASKGHAILKGVTPEKWHSTGNLYLLNNTTDKKATILMMGSAAGKTEPVAWTRLAGKSRVFYTSLGYPDDFDLPQFRKLLVNAIGWCIKGK